MIVTVTRSGDATSEVSRPIIDVETLASFDQVVINNEAYLKLVDQKDVRWQNRSHFFALASQLMRRILLDHARSQLRAKRGGAALHVNLDEVAIVTPEKSRELIALDEALERLAKFDPEKSRLVEMRFFGGLKVDEVAHVMGIAPVTVMVHWRLAKAWLQREMRSDAA